MGYISLQDRFRTSIKMMRFKKGMSQEDLANLSNMSVSYISDIERGKSCPSFQAVEDISQAFDVDPLELLSDKYYDEYSKNKEKIDVIRGRKRRS